MQPPIIKEVIHLENDGKPDGAMDRLFQYMTSLHVSGLFRESDEILNNIDVSLVSTDALLTLVFVSYHARHSLLNRDSFVNKVKIELKNRNEDIETLFKGLE